MKSSEDILARAFILLILADRGLLEEDTSCEKHTIQQREDKKEYFINLVKERGFINELLDSEKNILFSKIGSLSQDVIALTQFQYEAIQPLLWSVNIIGFPMINGKFCSIDFHDYIGKYGASNSNTKYSLKDAKNVHLMREVAMLWHWRSREGINNNNFNNINLNINIPKTFGIKYKQYLEYIKLSQHVPIDFLVDNVIFNKISREVFDVIVIKTQWIHHALEWIMSEDDWEETDTST